MRVIVREVDQFRTAFGLSTVTWGRRVYTFSRALPGFAPSFAEPVATTKRAERVKAGHHRIDDGSRGLRRSGNRPPEPKRALPRRFPTLLSVESVLGAEKANVPPAWEAPGSTPRQQLQQVHGAEPLRTCREAHAVGLQPFAVSNNGCG